jgi:hypothetical protein
LVCSAHDHFTPHSRRLFSAIAFNYLILRQPFKMKTGGIMKLAVLIQLLVVTQAAILPVSVSSKWSALELLKRVIAEGG